MIHIFRQHQRKMMLVVAVLTIIAFVWLYNPASTDKLSGNTVATVYGRNLSRADLERQVKNYQLALALGQLELLRELGGMAQNEDLALEEFVCNLMVLRHEARKLGIMPTDLQIADRIKGLQVFQTARQFDPVKYKTFLTEQLGPRGFTEEQLEGVIRDVLQLERLRAVVSSPVAVHETEIAEAKRALQKVDVQVLRFQRSSFEGGLQIADEEIKGFYEKNKPGLLAPEMRSVSYVEFELPADRKQAQGRTKVEALQKLVDAASAFSEAVQAGSFEKAAADLGLAVKQSPEFDQSGKPAGDAGELAPDLGEIARAAFLLTEDNPSSDILQSNDKLFVIKLARVTPQRPMTPEEVRPMAEQRLRAIKADRVLRDNANAVLGRIRTAMSGGKPFAQAAEAEGLKVESLKGLEPAARDNPAATREVLMPTLLMKAGDLSGVISSNEGALVVHLLNRGPADQVESSRSEEIRSGILAAKRELLFATWLSDAREAAKISFQPHQG